MNTTTLTLIIFALAIAINIVLLIRLKKIKREKQEMEETLEVKEKFDMHMAAMFIHHDYKSEEIVDILLEGVKRHEFDKELAKATFMMYDAVSKFIDSARENGIIK